MRKPLKIMRLKRTGSAIILAMFAVLILFITGVGLFRIGLNSRVYAMRTAEDIKARCAADAGLAQSIYEMNLRLSQGTLDDDALPFVSDAQLEGSDTYFSYTVTKNGSEYLIEAIGSAGFAQRTVKTSLIMEGTTLDYAIFGDEGVELNNSALVDWYNNDPEDGNLKVGTNSTQNDKVSLKNSAKIKGDCFVGVGGDPDDVIELKNSAEITGDTGTLTQESTLTSVSLPSSVMSVASLPSGGTIDENTTLPAGSYKFTAIDLGNSETLTINGDVVIYVTDGFSLGNSSEVNINNGNVVLYVTNDFSLGNSSDININSDSSLKLYAGGNFEAKNSSSLNNTTQIPSNLLMYCLDSCTSVDFKNSSNLYGVIYAPKADVVFHNSADIYGALAAKTIELKNSARVYYDADLRDTTLEIGSDRFVVNHWSEN